MKPNNRKGFTLLELIISLALSAILLVILLAAMRMSYKSQERGYEKADTTQKIRILGDRITWLIRGAYPFSVRKSDGVKLYFKGEEDRLGFVTTSVDYFGKGPEDTAGLKWVSIFLDNEGLQIREMVYFLEDVFDDEDGKLYVLAPEVKKLEFEYFDMPEDETQGDWVSDWDPDEKEYLPSAVKVIITFEHNGKTVALPEIIISINARKKEQL
jgi:prepilin-type N-terminal cleavage/methylation domain-containing protein